MDSEHLPKIEHSGNAVYAVHTPHDGPAIYASLGDLADAILSDSVEVHEGDQEYYDGREWMEVRPDDLPERLRDFRE